MYEPNAEFVRPDGAWRGVAAICAYLESLSRAQPRRQTLIQDVLACGEAATVEWSEAQDPQERFADVFRFRDGRICSHHQYGDPLPRVRRLAKLHLQTGTDTAAPTPTPAPTQTLAAPLATAPAMATMVAAQPIELTTLRIEAGPDQGLTCHLNGHPVRIGRSLDNDFVLRDPATSGHHASFERRNGEVFVVDLDSTNGTFVNGEQVHEQRLGAADRVTIGQNSLRLQS